jgi:hypothetical protein
VAEDWERSLFRLFGKGDGLEVQALDDPRSVDGRSFAAALVRSEKVRDWVLLFDTDGRLAGMEYQGEGPAGMAKITELYADWAPEAGVQLPRASKVLMDGQPFMDARVKSVKVNGTVAADVFAKPAQ